MLLGACLGGVALTSTWGAQQWIPLWADQLAGSSAPQARSYTQIASALGAIAGTLTGAMLGRWLGRRVVYTLLCLSSLGSAMILYQVNSSYGSWFLASVLLVGFTTASFYGWLPLYLPELFRTAVRATGQGFSYNFGRILAAMGVLQTGNLMQDVFKNNYPQALSVVSLVYLVGLALIWLAPETHGKPLPE
jgi:SHS family sialic acid transporter-like MFS transporter